jgi:signal transduction histidine kinase/ABC-type multidrug transport system ATPase subunit
MQGVVTDAPLLEARGLSVRYGPVTALDSVDLDLYRGQVVALAGENGAGKSTLVRCIAGDVVPDSGRVHVQGRAMSPDRRAAARMGVAVVWQDLALCDNLDISANLLLGREGRRLMFSSTRFHEQARQLLDELQIRLPPVTTPVAYLSGGQRQLVAVARALLSRPQLLVLDEPTSSLGVAESVMVEQLTASLPAMGTTILMVTHDLDQMFRMADRIVVLRRGRVVAQVRPFDSHPDEVAALMAGQAPDDSARRQLNRLHSLAGQLATAEPSSGLEVIMSALGAALGVERLCVHVQEGETLKLVASVGLPADLSSALAQLSHRLPGGQIGRAFVTRRLVTSNDVATDPSWLRWRAEAGRAGIASSWSVPFAGAGGDAGVVTLMSDTTGAPRRDDIELTALYAGYMSSALERDRLLGEVTARNRVLEAIRDVLQALAGPMQTDIALRAALNVLHSGLGADTVALIAFDGDHLDAKSWSGKGPGPSPGGPLIEAVAGVMGRSPEGTHREWLDSSDGGRTLVATFPAPSGWTALVTHWAPPGGPDDGAEALVEDAANSLQLALEREAAERAQRETLALRRSQEQQRQFLSFLSHELRTPLTAIRGYASSLMSTDVDWDGLSQQRFLHRISEESARLGRLVEDLLDFSAIDSGILRLQPDWCDLNLVAEAARACLSEASRQCVEIRCDPEVSVIWADHDRLEQILVNLLDNSVRHNPAGTPISLRAVADPPGSVTITVADDGIGMPPEWLEPGPRGRRGERRSRTGGAGLGLSIARGIVEAHGGDLEIRPRSPGTECVIRLPVALGAPAEGGADPERMPAR